MYEDDDETCDGTCHVFLGEVPVEEYDDEREPEDQRYIAQHPDSLRCACGEYTWGDMNAKLERTEGLEAMWERSK